MSNDNNKLLFSQEEMEKMEPNNLFHPDYQKEPVTCLGMTFPNDEARRKYFRDELRKKLPELKLIEGFPIGEDDDIINLSDPPYYTACPNPWLNDFIEEWEREKVVLEKEGKRKANFEVSEPYFEDVIASKNSPIYNAHSYHTKVPHEVIMKYLLHYTQPGDVIIDNFGGTGMTGVASNELNNPLEYIGKQDNNWGYRNCICGDLSTIASFITHNYTNEVSKVDFVKAAELIFKTLESELSWMYKTFDDNVEGKVNYYIWSEVQICPHCGNQFTYWDVAVDFENHIVKDKYSCPHCSAEICKRQSQKAKESFYDDTISETYERIKYVPVVVNYTILGKRKERRINDYDKTLLDKIQNYTISNWCPTNKMMGIGEHWGDTWRAGYHVGFNHVHNFYTRRNLIILSRFYSIVNEFKCEGRLKSYLMSWFTSSLSRLHVMNRYAVNHHRHVGPLANTLYISGTPAEISPFYFIKSKIRDNDINIRSNNNVINQVCSATGCQVLDNSIDYIFTDPPFGGNIMYSELNYITESWLRVFTNNHSEAITNDSQDKSTSFYHDLMLSCFREYYRILKPNKWMTVEFSNTSASIWNSIQQAIQQAGFIIAYVSDLNKGRGGLHGIYSVVAVNQDLAITCYKPLNQKNGHKTEEVLDLWSFIEDFLNHLPVHVLLNDKTTSIFERNPKILFDRLVSYYVQRGYPVPIDAIDFQKELRDRYIERDGMFFTATQAVEYDEKKKNAPEFVSLGIIVSDESSGIQWLKNQLRDTPKTYQELQPEWMQAINGLRKNDILPELKQILEENFIEMEGGKWRIPNIQDDVDKEALRTKSLLREFKKYVEVASKPKAKIKEARVEALRAGFKQCYIDKNFETIVLVGNKIPQNLRDEDEVLLQFYDIALNKI